MREIKFRGHDAEFLRELEPDKLSFYLKTGLPIFQYTGLKDKNNKEIYEGDIVQAELKIPNKPSVTVHEVVWSEYGFALTNGSLYHILTSGELEVIGNIYEKKTY